MLAAFRKGLAATGYVEGRGVLIEFRFADGQYNRLPALMEDLVGRRVLAVATGGGLVSAAAAKAASATIPIIFNVANDPVQFGLVESMNRPGRNLTGVTSFRTLVMEKQIGLFSELLHSPTAIALLIDPQMTESEPQVAGAQKAAAAIGHETMVVQANSDSALDAAFAEMVEKKAGALLVAASPFLYPLPRLEGSS
jgi:putative ABC transport system substrate-binding protein